MTFSEAARSGLRLTGSKTTALVVGALATSLLLAVALVFSGASGAAAIANSSRQLNWATSAAASAGVVRAATAQAVVFAVDHQLGVTEAPAVEAAVGEAEEGLRNLRSIIAAAPEGVAATHLEALVAYEDAATSTVALAAQGRPSDADAAQRGDLTTTYRTTAEGLGAMQATLAADIADAEATAGRVALTARTLATFLLPVAAILIYRRLAGRELERRKTAMRTKLAAAEHLSRAKDEFIAGMSHELRTPLTSICGFSDYLLDTPDATAAEVRDVIGLIHGESAELARMVDDLLVAGRLDADALMVRPRHVDLRREIDDVVAPFRRAGHHIRIHGEHPAVFADPGRVRQIMRNLVSNAVKHGGDDIEISLMTIGDAVECTVVDSGDGVDPAIAPRLFDRFVHDGKTTLLTGSAGLGLAISRSLARHMGGDLTYDRYGHWTAFSMTLPATNPATASSTAEPTPLPRPRTAVIDAKLGAPVTVAPTAASTIPRRRPHRALRVRFDG